MWPFTGTQLTYQGLKYYRKLTLSHQLKISDNSLARGRNLCPIVLPMLEFCVTWDYTYFFFHGIKITDYCEFMCTAFILCFWKLWFSCGHPPLPEFFLLPFLQWSLSLWSRYWGIHIPLMLNIFQSLILHFGQFWVSVVIIIYCKQMFLWWGLWDALIYGYNERSLRVGLNNSLKLTQVWHYWAMYTIHDPNSYVQVKLNDTWKTDA